MTAPRDDGEGEPPPAPTVRPAAVLAVTCCMRGPDFHQGDADVEVRARAVSKRRASVSALTRRARARARESQARAHANILPGVPVAGFFANGELGPTEDGLELLGYSTCLGVVGGAGGIRGEAAAIN